MHLQVLNDSLYYLNGYEILFSLDDPKEVNPAVLDNVRSFPVETHHQLLLDDFLAYTISYVEIGASAPLIEQHAEDPIHHGQRLDRVGSVFEEIIVSALVFLFRVVLLLFIDSG